MRRRIDPTKRAFAKNLRGNSTDAEKRLWSLLRGNRLNGLKFKRQVPLDGYILDFVCFEERLIVEIDGSQHSGSVSDTVRDAHFREAGFRTVRFWNVDVLQNLEGVRTRLVNILSGLHDCTAAPPGSYMHVPSCVTAHSGTYPSPVTICYRR